MIYKYPYALYYGYYSLHYVMSKIIKKEEKKEFCEDWVLCETDDPQVIVNIN
jgi:hypothetical protein